MNPQLEILRSDPDITKLLELQSINLEQSLEQTEVDQQGFVTVLHTPELIKKFMALAPQVVAQYGDELIGYSLSMHPLLRDEIPILIPMFNLFDQLIYNEKPLNTYTYIVNGQICVDKPWRGKGLFEKLYQKQKEALQEDYEMIITEIATRNQRSLRAHYRLGFEKLANYSSGGEHWEVIIWDWGS